MASDDVVPTSPPTPCQLQERERDSKSCTFPCPSHFRHYARAGVVSNVKMNRDMQNILCSICVPYAIHILRDANMTRRVHDTDYEGFLLRFAQFLH